MRISRARYEKLAQAIRDILAAAIVQGGSTLRDFIAVNGQSGYFQQTYFVYDRAGVPCRNCGAPVRQIAMISSLYPYEFYVKRDSGIKSVADLKNVKTGAITEKKVDHLHVASVGNPSMPIPTLVGGLPGMESIATKMMKKEMEKLDIPNVREMTPPPLARASAGAKSRSISASSAVPACRWNVCGNAGSALTAEPPRLSPRAGPTGPTCSSMASAST